MMELLEKVYSFMQIHTSFTVNVRSDCLIYTDEGYNGENIQIVIYEVYNGDLLLTYTKNDEIYYIDSVFETSNEYIDFFCRNFKYHLVM